MSRLDDIRGRLEELQTVAEVEALFDQQGEDIAYLLRLLGRARGLMLDMAGGHDGKGIRTHRSGGCLWCVRADGLILHDPDCALAALLRDLRGSDE